MKLQSFTFKPVLVARGVVKFQFCHTIPARNSGGSHQCKTLATHSRLLTSQEVQALGYDAQAMIDRFERERLSSIGIHVCQFCTSVWGVGHEYDYRDAYTQEEAPRVWCCGRCYAKVLHAPWASSPYALYGKGPRWADMKNGQSPWAGRALI